MAAGEVTGWSVQQVAEESYLHTEMPLYQDHDIPFETAYCLAHIGKQPDDYEGGPRFCSNRASKLTEEEWAEEHEGEYQQFDTRAYCATCRFHGRNRSSDANIDNLESLTAAITHGLYAEDEHLRMDFTDAEQALYDGIIEDWPDIYDWPEEDEDPARYLILRKVATNVVRTVRAEDYIDDEGEVHMKSIYDEGIEVGQEPEENPLSGEYRLLWREITNNLKELGLTPKERAKQGAQEKSANALEAIGEVASEALSADQEYDPEQFEESNDDENAT